MSVSVKLRYPPTFYRKVSDCFDVIRDMEMVQK